MSQADARLSQSAIQVPPDATPEMVTLVGQLNKYFSDVNLQLNRLTSGLYVKGDTIPHFMPKATVQGTVAFFNGSSWTILPPGTAGQKLQTNGAGANPTWV